MSQSAEELRAEAARQRAELSTTVDAIGDRMSPGRIVERRTNRMKDRLSSARDAVMGSADHAAHAVADAAGGASSSAASMPSAAVGKATDAAAGNPLAAGAVAFGLGFLAAAAFPGTRMEKRAASQLQEAAQPLVAELKEAGQEAAEHLKAPAQEAVQAVKEAAQDTATDVKDVAREKAEETKGSAADAVQDVRAKAPGGS